MDEIAGTINEQVILQIGYTNYKPINADYFDFKNSSDEIKQLNRAARVVVSHAGVGSILTAIDEKTPVIIVPRQKKFNEHIDDHQLEIAKTISDNKNLIVAYNIEDLDELLKLNFTFTESNNKSTLVKSIKDYLISISY